MDNTTAPTRPIPPTLPASRRTRRTGALAATGLAAALLALSACSGDAEPRAGIANPNGTDLQQVQGDSGVPEACLEAFPVAVGEADLDDVTLLPAGWPAPPVEATLCQTTGTVDGNLETADYATAASAEQVLDAYEAALPAEYTATRQDQGMGDQLTGAAGSVYFTITTRDGAYSVASRRGRGPRASTSDGSASYGVNKRRVVVDTARAC
jgi:hypothetical protein